MKNKKGYLLLESVVSLFIIVSLSLSIYSLLFYCTRYQNTIQDKVELQQQAQEMIFQINKTIENSEEIMSMSDANNKIICGEVSEYTKVNSIKCKYNNKYENIKSKEISYKSNNKLFINTLNNNGGNESGGYEIGSYIDGIYAKVDKNKVYIKLELSKNSQTYETDFKSYIKDFNTKNDD